MRGIAEHNDAQGNWKRVDVQLKCYFSHVPRVDLGHTVKHDKHVDYQVNECIAQAQLRDELQT